MRHVLTPVLVLVLLATSGCASGVAPSRESPAGTIEQFKVASRLRDYHEQWDILSPNLKRRLSDRAGRNLDFGDYRTFMNAQRNDPQVKNAEAALQAAQVGRVVMHDANRATATVSGPMGLGGSYQIGMVRLDRWELEIKGDPQPYDGIVGDIDSRITRAADGSYIVTMHDPHTGSETWRQVFPAADVESYKVVSKWYVDDLGDLEAQFAAQ